MRFDFMVSHKNCPDGKASRWIVEKYCTQHNLPFPRMYWQSPAQDLTLEEIQEMAELGAGKPTYLLVTDKCFSMPLTFGLLKKHNIRVMILDHHKPSLRKVEQAALVEGKEWIIDECKCGATITWEFLFPNVPMPSY